MANQPGLAMLLAFWSGCASGDYFVKADEYQAARAAHADEVKGRRIEDGTLSFIRTDSIVVVPAPPRSDGLLFVKSPRARTTGDGFPAPPRDGLPAPPRNRALLRAALGFGVAGAIFTAAGAVWFHFITPCVSKGVPGGFLYGFDCLGPELGNVFQRVGAGIVTAFGVALDLTSLVALGGYALRRSP